MLLSIVGALRGTARSFANRTWEWGLVARDAVNGMRIAAYHALLVCGSLAIVVLAALFVKPDLTDHVKVLSPFFDTEMLAQQQYDPGDQDGLQDIQLLVAAYPAAPAGSAKSEQRPATTLLPQQHHVANLTQEQARVTSWLSRRYRVAHNAAAMLVSASYKAADESQLDPLLILAVMAIESRLNPFAESPVGAQGLMQVMSRVHHDKFQPMGGVHVALDPIANIRVGTMILKDYVRRGGSIEAGLKMYVGAANLAHDSGYGFKVLSELRHLKNVAGGKKVSYHVTNRTPPRQAAKDGDKTKLVEAVASTKPETIQGKVSAAPTTVTSATSASSDDETLAAPTILAAGEEPLETSGY